VSDVAQTQAASALPRPSTAVPDLRLRLRRLAGPLVAVGLFAVLFAVFI
jgi:hypothetical protein